jgi:hypothetical protein
MASICSSVEYVLKDDDTFDVITDGISDKTGEKVSVSFKAVLSDPTASIGKFNVSVFECKRPNIF